MAMLDLSRVLTNPRLTTKFDVVRREQKVNPGGRAKVEAKLYENVRGVLHPEGMNDLLRRPDSEIQEKSAKIFTRFPLRGESRQDPKQFQPDLVKWKGDAYVVIHVEDYSNYARGFVCATLEAIDIVNWPPNPVPMRGNPS